MRTMARMELIRQQNHVADILWKLSSNKFMDGCLEWFIELVLKTS